MSVSSEETNEWNNCSADCCTATHVHWSVNNLNCAGLSVLDMYMVWAEHRGRCQINHTAEKKANKQKKYPKKVDQGWREKKGSIVYKVKRAREKGKFHLPCKRTEGTVSDSQ